MEGSKDVLLVVLMFAAAALATSCIVAAATRCVDDLYLRRLINRGTVRRWLSRKGRLIPLISRDIGVDRTLSLVDLVSVGHLAESRLANLLPSKFMGAIGSVAHAIAQSDEERFSTGFELIGRALYLDRGYETRDLLAAGRPRHAQARQHFVDRALDDLQAELDWSWVRGRYAASMTLSMLILVPAAFATQAQAFATAVLVVLLAATSTVIAPFARDLLDRILVIR
jgi:hypothetical protein